MNPPVNRNLSLLTDLYELTMAASYFEHKQNCLASFDLFIRDFPKARSFFIAAGLADVIEFLRTFHFDEESLKYLEGLEIFSKDFLHFLSNLRFRGSLFAIPEGTIFFPNEPIIRVIAPIIEAQLLESFLLNTINLQTTITTKAARVVLAAEGKGVFDFSLRRTHGSEAAMKVARCAYLAGFQGTSNVLAGKIYGIPVIGTMAHSFVMAFDDELSSFRAFVNTFPNYSTLLVDTYDSISGIHNAITIAHELEKKGHRIRAIRLDSGNLVRLSNRARFLLNKAGLSYVKIFASGNLDEYAVSNLLKHGVPVDSFGVGTKMGVSADSPYCDVIYKLSEITDIQGRFLPTMKLSKGKVSFPGRKQIYRFTDKRGMYRKDVIGLEDEKIGGTPLLTKVIDNGVVVYNQPSLKQIKDFIAQNLLKLPAAITDLTVSQKYPVEVSPRLKGLIHSLRKNIRKKNP